MTSTEIDIDIEVAGHSYWLPLELDLSHADQVARIVDVFATPEDPPSRTALTAGIAEHLAGMADGMRERRDEARARGLWFGGAWVRMEEPRLLSPMAVATLRAVPLTGDDPLELIAAVAMGATLHNTPEPRTVETASGPASHVTLRYLEANGDVEEIHEQHVVAWLRPEQSYAVAFSTYDTDLVESARTGALLDELASGVSGL